MKYLTALACILLQLSLAAQKKETFYDYFWKPCEPSNARYYSTLEKKDSGWLRYDYFISNKSLQMKALYEDSGCKILNGYCSYFYANGTISTIGRMVHNKQEGICLQYYSNGMMADSALFHNGTPIGSRILWHHNGYMSDSIYHLNDSVDVHITWNDNGSLDAAGYSLRGKPTGKWKYYHRNGTLAAEEIYKNGVPITKNYFNEDGTPQTDTAKVNTPASFKTGGPDAWKKYVEKGLYWPANYKLTNTNTVTVGISFTINEEGKMEDVEVSVPFYPDFDKIALAVVRDSPIWKPAISHNRKIKSSFNQPVTFQQED